MPKCKRVVNGKTQYRTTYRWRTIAGEIKQTTTPWCNTKLEANKMAEALIKEKEGSKPADKERVFVVFDKFVAELEEIVNDDSLRNKSTEIIFFQRARTLREKSSR